MMTNVYIFVELDEDNKDDDDEEEDASGRSLTLAAYLIFVIFLHWQNFWRKKFTPKNANLR